MAAGSATALKTSAPAGWRRVASLVLFLLCLCLTGASAQAQENFAPTDTVVYKHSGAQDLHLWIWDGAKNAGAGKHAAAVILFHGGSFIKGRPDQFSELSKMLSNYGLLVVSVEYRLAVPHDSELQPLIEDARSAVRWVRSHADELHIDPNRIAVGGGSAGGLLALSTVVFDDVNDPSDNQAVSAGADALLLFNPVYSPDELSPGLFRAHPGARLFSATEALKQPLPPTLIMHGTDDRTVNFQYAQDFVQKAAGAGSKTVTLKPFEGRRHGFFNDRGGRNPDFIATSQDVVDFLHGLGWIDCGADCQVRRP